MTAEIKKLMATPTKSNVSMLFLSLILLIINMINKVRSPVAKAGKVMPKQQASQPKMKAKAPPSELPEEMPNTYGSQMGLRKMDWKTQPQAAKLAPTKTLITMRVNRNSKSVIV